MKKYSDMTAVGIAALAAVLVCVFGFALCLAVTSRPRVIRLDPYAAVSIEGVDGYAQAMARFDREAFGLKLREMILSAPDLIVRKKADELSGIVADAVEAEIEIQKGEHALREPVQDAPADGIFNGDTAVLVFYVREEAQSLLRENGLYYIFQCGAIRETAQGLPEVVPYDPFSDLNVSFSGIDGAGEVSLSYEGKYPLAFTAEPAANLHNGDAVRLFVSYRDGYDLNLILADYRILPSSLEKEYTVAGLLFYPASPEDFSDSAKALLRQGLREKAVQLIEEEYSAEEQLASLDEEGLYFQAEGAANCLVGLYRVKYVNVTGAGLEYYYYVRIDDFLLGGGEEVLADFEGASHPQKPGFLFGELLGMGDGVSVPGFLGLPTLRTLSGFETLEQMKERVIAPLEKQGEVCELP